jgi:hypothetical protein
MPSAAWLRNPTGSDDNYFYFARSGVAGPYGSFNDAGPALFALPQHIAVIKDSSKCKH